MPSWPYIVAHAFNPIYLGDGDQEDFHLRPAPGQKLARPPSQQKKAGCGRTDLSFQLHKRIMVQANLGKNARFYLKNNYIKRGLGGDSSGKSPSYQCEALSLNPSTTKIIAHLLERKLLRVSE
jgi:hypothetical protein